MGRPVGRTTVRILAALAVALSAVALAHALIAGGR